MSRSISASAPSVSEPEYSTCRRDVQHDDTQQKISNLSVIVSHLSFFQQLPRELCDKLLSHMTIRKFPKQSCVAHENHSSDSLVIVLSGTFAVFSDSNTVAAAASTLSKSESQKGSNDVNDQAMKLMKQSTTPNLGEYVCTLAPGDCFGAFGFLEQAPRASSLLALDDCELLTLQFHVYERVIRTTLGAAALLSRRLIGHALRKQSAKQWTLEERDAILKALSIDQRFQMLSEEAKESIAELSHLENLDAGHVVQDAREPDSLKNCFVVLSGTISGHINSTNKGRKLSGAKSGIEAVFGECRRIYIAGQLCGNTTEAAGSVRLQPCKETLISRQSCVLLRLPIHEVNIRIARFSDSMPQCDKIIRIASTPVRSNADNRFLLHELQHLAYFQQLEERIAVDICASLRLIRLPSHAFVQKHLEAATEMHVVVQGSLIVYEDANAARSAESTHDHSQANRRASGTPSKPRALEGKTNVGPGQKSALNTADAESPSGNERRLTPGQCVGVEALYMNERTPHYRQTVLSRTSVHLLVLRRRDVLDVFSHAAGRGTCNLSVGSDVESLMAEKKTQEVIRILGAPAADRSEGDLAFLSSALSFSKFVSDMPVEMRRHVLRLMRYKRVPGHSLVLEQGDVGDKFYIVLRGSVSVHIKSSLNRSDTENSGIDKLECAQADISTGGKSCSDTDDEAPVSASKGQRRFTAEQEHIRRMMIPEQDALCLLTPGGANEPVASDGAVNTESALQQIGNSPYKERRIYDNHLDLQNANLLPLFGPCFVTLMPGCSFGELALVNAVARGATVVTRTDTDLVTLKRRHYLRTLRNTTAFGADFFAEVLRKTYPFSSWRWPDLMRLGRVAEYRKYKPSEFVAQQGLLANELFVVIQGSVKLSQDVMLDASGSMAFEQAADTPKGATVRVDVAVIGRHEVVGELDMLERRPRRVSVVSLSSIEVLVLRRSCLLNLVPKSTLHELEALGNSREELHLRRVEKALMRVSSAEMRRMKLRKRLEQRREARRIQLQRNQHNAPVKQGWYSITGRRMQTILAPIEERLEAKQLDGRQTTTAEVILESGQRARRMLRRLYDRQSASLVNDDAGGSALALHVASNLSKMLRFDTSSYMRYLRVSPSVHFDDVNELQTPRRPSLGRSQTAALLPEVARLRKGTTMSHHSPVDEGAGQKQQQSPSPPRALMTSVSVPSLSRVRPGPYGYSRMRHRFGEKDKNTDHLTWLTCKYLKPGSRRPQQQ